MKIVSVLKRYLFFLILVLSFLALDTVLAHLLPQYVIDSGRFHLNDYEVVRRDHPEKTWDKVFYGNSVVISAYREDVSGSGYVNLGLDYGVLTDLTAMLRRGQADIGSELVLGLNDLTLYDKFDTDPSYPWHRRTWEPYAYFARDRLRVLFEETAKHYVTGFMPDYGAYADQTRGYYYGSMSKSAIEEKVNGEDYAKYLSLPLEDFSANFHALEELSDYCARRGIRLRVVWMPRTPQLPPTPSIRAVQDRVEEICEREGIEFLDMGDALDVSCFYDIGHLNYEYGAYVFTKEIDPWLVS